MQMAARSPSTSAPDELSPSSLRGQRDLLGLVCSSFDADGYQIPSVQPCDYAQRDPCSNRGSLRANRRAGSRATRCLLVDAHTAAPLEDKALSVQNCAGGRKESRHEQDQTRGCGCLRCLRTRRDGRADGSRRPGWRPRQQPRLRRPPATASTRRRLRQLEVPARKGTLDLSIRPPRFVPSAGACSWANQLVCDHKRANQREPHLYLQIGHFSRSQQGLLRPRGM
jgi:hypothetical protein